PIRHIHERWRLSAIGRWRGVTHSLSKSPSAVASTRRTMRPSLRRNFAWTFAGNSVYMASQWGMLVVLAKLGSPSVVGQFAYALAIVSPAILFGNLQLRAILATDIETEYEFGDYVALRLLTSMLVV